MFFTTLSLCMLFLLLFTFLVYFLCFNSIFMLPHNTSVMWSSFIAIAVVVFYVLAVLVSVLRMIKSKQNHNPKK